MHPDFKWLGKSKDGETVTLRKFSGAFNIPSYVTREWLEANSGRVRTAVAVDVETTGLNRKSDAVIEIGLRRFRFDRGNGDLVEVGDSYTALQDPGKPLSDDIKNLTGLTDADVRGKSIDWTKVEQLIGDANLIIAHNASFDRPFVDRFCKLSAQKIWACSLKQINWGWKGFGAHKLDVLSIYHGFFTDSHRAMNDADALLNLITMNDWTTRKTYLSELLVNARRPVVRVTADRAAFEYKDVLKEYGYGWDNAKRVWQKTVFQDELASEVAWLESAVYKGKFAGRSEEIPPVDNFKS